MARGLIIAAPRSGSGKTTVTLGLLAALRKRGIRVAAAKSGPDYIDPAFHAAATGRPGLNLDSWAMPPALVESLLADAAADAELIIIEASMGLFDGVGTIAGRRGAAADLAARHGLPVVLVMDVSGQSQSAGAVARGFASHDPAVRIAGVILNRVGSDRHRAQVTEAMAPLGLPVLGSIRRDTSLTLPERHLGLVQADEHADLAARLDALGVLAEEVLDLDALMALAAPVPAAHTGFRPALPPPGQRIAIARDAAFSFIYPHLLAHWRRAGAAIVFFSPLDNEGPPDDCDVCWLPGGYPELHAGRLAAASGFRESMHRFAATRPVHGECGGYMVLGEIIEDAEGVSHPMLGLLGHRTSFAQRRMNLGYREAVPVTGSIFGPASVRIRGHEFHYARITDRGHDAAFAELFDSSGMSLGMAGGRRGLVSGTFFHAISLEFEENM